MDIDGNFPLDHAPTGSYNHQLLLEHLQNTGELTTSKEVNR